MKLFISGSSIFDTKILNDDLTKVDLDIAKMTITLDATNPGDYQPKVVIEGYLPKGSEITLDGVKYEVKGPDLS